MKKRNKLFALLLALAMIVTYMPAMAFAESAADAGGQRAAGEGQMTLDVSNTTLETCEDFEFSAECPGADLMRCFFNGTNDEGWGYDNEGGESIEGVESYGSEGEYEFVVVAYKHDDNTDKDVEIDRASQIITVSAPKGDITVDMPELPSYIVAGRDGLSFTANKPQNADELSVGVWYELDGDDENDELYNRHTSGSSLSVNLKKEKFKENMLVRVRINAMGRGYNEGEIEVNIPVVSEVTQYAALNVSADSALVNTDIDCEVVAAKDKKIKLVDFFGGYDFWGEREPDEDGVFRTGVSFGNKGYYSIFARVLFQGSDEWVTTEPVTIAATSNGRTGSFQIAKVDGKTSFDSLTVERGTKIEIECTKADHADNYWVDAEITRVNDEGDEYWENYDGGIANTDSNVISLNTIVFEPGLYLIRAGACSEGYENSYSDNVFELTVTDLDLEDGEMYFDVSKTELDTGEDFEAVAYCPGAEAIQFLWNYEEDENWDDWEGGEVVSRYNSYGESGVYKIVARAYDEDENMIAESDPVTMTVTASKGDLVITMPELPAYLVAGKDGLNFTFKQSEHSDHIKAEVEYDMDDDEENHRLYEGESFDGNLDVSVPKDYLKEEMMLNVKLNAWGRGYNGAYEDVRIPVVGAASDSVSITASKTDVMVSEDIRFTVSAGGKKMEAVKFFNGWDLEEEWLDEDNNTEYTRWSSLDRAGEYKLFAMVKLQGSDKWLTSKPISIKATSKGQVGEFHITKINGVSGADSATVKRGEIVKLEYTKAENADHYWIDVNYKNEWGDWDWFNHYSDTDELINYLGTGDFEPGKYAVQLKANGLGYEESQTGFMLTVTESDVAHNKISLIVSQNEAITNENVVFSAFCEDADRIEVYSYEITEDEDEVWRDSRDGKAFVDTIVYDYPKDHKLIAVAYDENDNEIDRAEQTIKVTAPYGELTMEDPVAPEKVCPGGFTVTLKKPAKADSIGYISFKEKEGEDWDELGGDGTKNSTLDIVVPPFSAKLNAGDKVFVGYGAFGKGYAPYENHFEVDIVSHDMTKHPAKKVTKKADGNTEYYSCSICGKYYTDAEGKNEIEEGSWVVARPTDLPKVTISKPAPAKKSVTVKWTKLSAADQEKIDKIEVWVCPNKKFKKKDSTVKTAGKNKTSLKVKGLKSKKTYYVKVRTLKVVDGVKFYGSWSSVKKFTVK